ncbi:protein FAM166A [Onychostruthus taczanowskii]|uniref:protein FAM166A n=1 Tax=Onychostruthus taczanowskii TaxID=356909 RepID=UPI001B809116|nr:protein FAM166A [Onychostruthus taczanowskii]
MAGFKGNSIFPQNPYHIPGYGGYVPQFTFMFGDTYGRTTHNLLTDPNVRKSPRSLLAPLDNKENLLEYHYHIDHPGYVTYQPLRSPPEVPLGPQPVPSVLEEPQPWRCPPGLAVPGPQQSPPEPLRGLALHPAAQEMDRELAMAPLARLLGTGAGQGSPAGSGTHLETGGVTLPGGVATADYTLPVLPVPNAIRQKATLGVFYIFPLALGNIPVQQESYRGDGLIPLEDPTAAGYTGYIPCSLDNVGMTYLLSVKKAMKEFDRRQRAQHPWARPGSLLGLQHRGAAAEQRSCRRTPAPGGSSVAPIVPRQLKPPQYLTYEHSRGRLQSPHQQEPVTQQAAPG